MSFIVEVPLLRAKNNDTAFFSSGNVGDMHQIIYNILISKIAAIHGSEDRLVIQYVHTWVGDAPESWRTTLSLSLTLLFGNS